MTSLQPSGERFLPDMQGNIALEHLHRYLMARGFVAGKVVLDIACGEGYGSALLAEAAARVIGVDISPEAVAHASSIYGRPNTMFQVGRCAEIPLSSASVDAVVSFETIEHHAEHEAMFTEIKRVLRPGGLLIMSSPDKLEYTELANHSNAYHVKELYADEFRQLVQKYFSHVVILGQRVLYASTMLVSGRSEESLHHYRDAGSGFRTQSGLVKPVYHVAIASDADLPPLGSSLFEQIGESDPEIKHLQHELDHTHRRIEGLQEEIFGLQAAIEAVLDSRSWRITRPLRAVMKWIRDIQETRRTSRL